MPLLLRILFSVAMVPFAMMNAAHAQDPNVHVVSYIEVLPSATDQALALLKPFAETSRKEEGNLRFEVLQRTTPSHHFAVLEAWRDGKAQEAHAAAAATKSLREKLQPLLASPYDERPHYVLAVGPSQPAGAASIFAVTHVDCIPPKKDDGIALLRAMVEPTREESGNGRFDVLQQASRPNHFTVVELWSDAKGVENHVAAAHTRQFRAGLHPIGGALYDERLYRAVN
jgi:quinol monooxygenase YgiN